MNNTVTKGGELAGQKHMLNINKLFKQEDVGDLCNFIGRVSSLAPSYDSGSPSYLSMKSVNRFDIFTAALVFTQLPYIFIPFDFTQSNIYQSL